MKPPSPTRWLWWLALIIGLAAYGIVYGLQQDVGNLKAQQNINAVVMFAVVAIGLCIISATSHWWLRR